MKNEVRKTGVKDEVCEIVCDKLGLIKMVYRKELSVFDKRDVTNPL